MQFLENVLKNKCLSCDICCRFPEKYSQLIPFFLHDEIKDEKHFSQIGKTYGCKINLAKYNNIYACPYFNGSKNNCGIYSTRPLDCRLYPFMITYDDNYTKAILVLDKNCPHADSMICFKEDVKKYIDSVKISPRDYGFINDPQPNTIFLGEIPKLIKGKWDGQIISYLWKDIASITQNYESAKKFSEYIYLRRDLIEFKGDKYKDKRNLCNYFQKKYSYKIEKLSSRPEVIDECITLYRNWAENKIKKADDSYIHKLIEDSFFFHKRALINFSKLNLQGIIIKIGGKIAGYTFGYALNEETFYILGEITDVRYKGISQFIFRAFCKGLPSKFVYINTMDDSDIPGLRKNKLSYHPIKR